MDASTSPNFNSLPHFSVPPSVPQPTTYFVAPVFSQNNVPSTEETSFFNLKLDVDGCLRELRKRDLETTQVERGGMGSNRRIGWEMNFLTNSMFAAASTPSPSVPRKNTKLKFVLEKQLTKSDVSSVGRILLPKKQAEAELPILEDKWGINLTVRDALSCDKWTMRYRYWANKYSKIYVLENTGNFIRKNNLKPGDFIAIYQDNRKKNFVCARKTERPPFPLELIATDEEEEGTDNSQTSVQSYDYSASSPGSITIASDHASSLGDIDAVRDHATEAIAKPWDSCSYGSGDSWSDDGFGVDYDLIDFYNRNHTQYGRLPSFDDQDLSLFDFSRPEEDDAERSRASKKK